MNKKAAEQMWWIIMTAVIAIVIVILVLLWFRGSGEKAFGTVGDKIAELKDRDGDTIADIFDKCPCEKEVGAEWPPELEQSKECRTKC